MYFTALPDHSAPQFDPVKHFKAFSERNIIFNAKARNSYCEAHVGCLSLKMCFEGEEWYRVNKVPYAVRKNSFLVLNQDQQYSSEIASGQPVHSFSIFFKPGFAGNILRGIAESEEKLLEDPLKTGRNLLLFQKLYPTGHLFQQKINYLIDNLEKEGYTSTGTDEILSTLLRDVILLNGHEDKYVRSVKSVKQSTRKEIYRRLCIVRDVMHSCFAEALQLEILCKYACLSLPQLIRQFKAVFGTTPHQYLTAIRLQHAAALLQNSALPVRDITEGSGFMDDSAFCRLFKKHYGSSPETFRKMHHSN